MARKKKQSEETEHYDQFSNDFTDGDVKTCSVERTLEELLFLNVDYTDIEKLKKLRRINKRKQIDIIKKLKDCLKEAI